MRNLNIQKKIITALIIFMSIFASFAAIYSYGRITQLIDSNILLVIYIILMIVPFVLLKARLIPSQLEVGLLVFILSVSAGIFYRWIFIGYTIPRLLSYYMLPFIFIFIYMRQSKLSFVKVFNLKPSINKIYIYILCFLGIITIHSIYIFIVVPIYSLLIKPYNVFSEVNSIFRRTFGSSAIIRTNLLYPILINLIACPSEELIFRGFIQSIFKKKYNIYIAVILTSLLFGIMHGSLLHIISSLLVGLYFSYIVYKSSNIYIAISGHFFQNVILQ